MYIHTNVSNHAPCRVVVAAKHVIGVGQLVDLRDRVTPRNVTGGRTREQNGGEGSGGSDSSRRCSAGMTSSIASVNWNIFAQHTACEGRRPAARLRPAEHPECDDGHRGGSEGRRQQGVAEDWRGLWCARAEVLCVVVCARMWLQRRASSSCWMRASAAAWS